MLQENLDERLEFIKKRVNLLKIRFPVAVIAKKTGFTKGQVSNILNGRVTASENFLDTFKREFPLDTNLFKEVEIPKEMFRALVEYMNFDSPVQSISEIMEETAATINSYINQNNPPDKFFKEFLLRFGDRAQSAYADLLELASPETAKLTLSKRVVKAIELQASIDDLLSKYERLKTLYFGSTGKEKEEHRTSQEDIRNKIIAQKNRICVLMGWRDISFEKLSLEKIIEEATELPDPAFFAETEEEIKDAYEKQNEKQNKDVEFYLNEIYNLKKELTIEHRKRFSLEWVYEVYRQDIENIVEENKKLKNSLSSFVKLEVYESGYTDRQTNALKGVERFMEHFDKEIDYQAPTKLEK